jgi:hypothetical protein
MAARKLQDWALESLDTAFDVLPSNTQVSLAEKSQRFCAGFLRGCNDDVASGGA